MYCNQTKEHSHPLQNLLCTCLTWKNFHFNKHRNAEQNNLLIFTKATQQIAIPLPSVQICMLRTCTLIGGICSIVCSPRFWIEHLHIFYYTIIFQNSKLCERNGKRHYSLETCCRPTTFMWVSVPLWEWNIWILNRKHGNNIYLKFKLKKISAETLIREQHNELNIETRKV